MNLPNIFFHPDISETCILREDESTHAIRVLRLRRGDVINVTDGKGSLFAGEISDDNPKKCAIKIKSRLRAEPFRSASRLHIAVAPTKNIDRFEWFLEKATEIGIDEITPLICGRSERRTLNADRLEKVLITAMKQSLNLFLPRLNAPSDFRKFIQLPGTKGEPLQKFIAHLPPHPHMANHLKNEYQKEKDAVVLIGPEGDFTEEEILLARENGFTEVSLGKTRLRTETAAIAACHTICLLNENQK